MLVVKNLPANAGDIRDVGSVPGLGRCPGGGHGNPLYYLAWRSPWTQEPGGLQSIGSHRVGHDCSNLAQHTILSLTLILYFLYFFFFFFLIRLASRVWLFGTPFTVAHQTPLSMEFPRQKYWSGLPFPSPGDLPDSY